eukprot:6489038-Amphidinium_carterae.2
MTELALDLLDVREKLGAGIVVQGGSSVKRSLKSVQLCLLRPESVGPPSTASRFASSKRHVGFPRGVQELVQVTLQRGGCLSTRQRVLIGICLTTPRKCLPVHGFHPPSKRTSLPCDCASEREIVKPGSMVGGSERQQVVYQFCQPATRKKHVRCAQMLSTDSCRAARIGYLKDSAAKELHHPFATGVRG